MPKRDPNHPDALPSAYMGPVCNGKVTHLWRITRVTSCSNSRNGSPLSAPATSCTSPTAIPCPHKHPCPIPSSSLPLWSSPTSPLHCPLSRCRHLDAPAGRTCSTGRFVGAGTLRTTWRVAGGLGWCSVALLAFCMLHLVCVRDACSVLVEARAGNKGSRGGEMACFAGGVPAAR